MNKETRQQIREARLTLRKLYDKYVGELKSVAEKIDLMLETLEKEDAEN